MSEEQRKKNAVIAKQIEELIMSADDPKDKAMLLVLNKIADSLDENTELTRNLTCDLKAHTAAFQQHEKDEMSLINQGRGFLRAAIIGLAAVQGLFAWYFQQHLEKTEFMADSINKLNEFKAEHKAHHDQEKETYKAWMQGGK